MLVHVFPTFAMSILIILQQPGCHAFRISDQALSQCKKDSQPSNCRLILQDSSSEIAFILSKNVPTDKNKQCCRPQFANSAIEHPRQRLLFSKNGVFNMQVDVQMPDLAAPNPPAPVKRRRGFGSGPSHVPAPKPAETDTAKAMPIADIKRGHSSSASTHSYATPTVDTGRDHSSNSSAHSYVWSGSDETAEEASEEEEDSEANVPTFLSGISMDKTGKRSSP